MTITNLPHLISAIFYIWPPNDFYLSCSKLRQLEISWMKDNLNASSSSGLVTLDCPELQSLEWCNSCDSGKRMEGKDRYNFPQLRELEAVGNDMQPLLDYVGKLPHLRYMKL